ncbi:MAG: tRNA (adenosine(37)-N6)-threonylcarbamoyltransferase complex ATPase subunit type 1 TsaE [Dongiaceae bacterium]
MTPADDMPILFQRRLPDEAATAALAAQMAPYLRPGDVIALEGDLGAGKTSFARALIHRLAAADEVPSPTFTLVQTYAGEVPLDDGTSLPVEIWHFDLYRLTRPEQAYDLAIEEAFVEGISLIEWPDRLDGLLPARRLTIRLATERDQPGRVAWAMGDAAWRRRLAPLLGERA